MQSRTIWLFLLFASCQLASSLGWPGPGQVSVARADVLATPMNSNNGQSGNMFDVSVLSSTGINVEAFDLNLDGGTWDLQLYSISSSYVGNETTPANWTLVDSITGLVSAGVDNPTLWDFNDVFLSAGTHAFYVTVTNGTAMNYTNGTSEGSLLASDANLQIFEGTGNQYPFGVQFRPRRWNGSIYYNVVGIPEPNSVAVIATLASAMGLTLRRRYRAIG